MSGPAFPSIAPCSRPSTPLRAAIAGALRPVLTPAARDAHANLGRDGKTTLQPNRKTSRRIWTNHFAELDARNSPLAASMLG
jgi:hypothetical protein